MNKRLFDASTEASELFIRAQCARAVFASLFDDFADHATPEAIADAVRQRPEQFLYLAATVERQIHDIVERADKLQDELGDLMHEDVKMGVADV